MLLKCGLMIGAGLLTMNLFARETDNYLTWNTTLQDSTLKVNEFVKNEIEDELRIINKFTSPQSCANVTIRIANRFKTNFLKGAQPFEEWAIENLGEGEIYPTVEHFLSDTVYKNPFRFYLKYFELAPSIQINGYYFGTDKLSHFASTGRRYFKKYLKSIARGYSDVEAQKDAVRYGLKNERTVLGFWPSGVFSYGDMEANFQGFLFFKKMCKDSIGNYLKKNNDDRWSMVIAPDLRDFVNGNWDEAYNHSYLLPRNWKKTSPVIKDLHCANINRSDVRERIGYYQATTKNSLSWLYIKELQELGSVMAPEPDVVQSIEELCASR